ncbi:MAG: hypothetical protein ACXAD7_06820 [Candidatus Kariarchaeaceae archaeon]|jgi:tRNA wybutosine-synthesizing protein 2
MKFRDHVLAIDNSIRHIPSGFKRLGDAIILRSKYSLNPKLGEIVLEIYSWCESVFQHITTVGESRKPKLIHLAGSTNTIIQHKENGVIYCIDISRITFSGGNSQLRKNLVERVQDGENLLDMFAAVGNLSLQPIMKKSIKAKLFEKDPYTFSFLQKTLDFNKLDPNIAKNRDCRNVQVNNWADRIFMGYHDVDLSHVKAAIVAARDKAIIHLHPLAKPNHYYEWENRYQKFLEMCKVEILEHNITKIKSYSPGLDHIEVEFVIRK